MSEELTNKLASRLGVAMKAAAPAGAFSGEWVRIVEQAAVSSCGGGYTDRGGNYVPSAADNKLFEMIGEAVDEIFLAGDQSWSVARVGWRAGETLATIETAFDPDIVPRGPDDAVYEMAAFARHNFWESVGKVSGEYLGGPARTNDHGQSRWFSPHRRLVLIRTADWSLLATDGLSTPWAGIPDKVNGCGIEVFLEVPGSQARHEQWIEIMLAVGDMIADDVGIEGDVTANGAILFFDLPDKFAPFSHLVLSVPREGELSAIPSLPFGNARLLKATAVTLDELANHSLDGWAVEAAKQALARRESIIKQTD